MNQEAQPRPRIMVVDDNVDFLNGIELTLQMEGFEVVRAASGQEALQILEQAFHRQMQASDPAARYLPDLIVADIMMPGLDGYALYEEISNNPYLAHIPFIFLTAKTEAEDIRKGKQLGVDDYLTKPFSPEDLLATIRGKLRRVEQQRTLAEQFTGEPDKSPALILALVIIGLLLAIGAGIGYWLSNFF
ncbi:MAG: DNA-binding response regulator [Chloroflexi bacterium]|nr:MAG: DNA-binding response regulator [Chloroflexota bacterium]